MVGWLLTVVAVIAVDFVESLGSTLDLGTLFKAFFVAITLNYLGAWTSQHNSSISHGKVH